MKNFLITMLASLFVLACTSANKAHAEESASTDQIGKTLVAYYSYTGNCEEIVKTLTEQISADVVRIQPAEKGLKYEANNYALGTQLLNAIKANPNDAASYPAIDPVNIELDDYQNVVIVTPLWWSQMSAIMQTFLFQNREKMSGKTVAMIVSSFSSSISGVVADAKRLLPDDVIWAGDALWINNANHQKRQSLVKEWLATQKLSTTNNSDMSKINITIGGVTHSATLVDNSSTQALTAQLQKGNITYEASDYGSFEKVGALGYSFPENNEYIVTEPGDLILYQGNALCIYYAQNSWNFTRIGKLDGMTQQQVKDFVNAGKGSVNVTLSLADNTATGIADVRGDKREVSGNCYTLDGRLAKADDKGIIIQNGKKIIR